MRGAVLALVLLALPQGPAANQEVFLASIAGGALVTSTVTNISNSPGYDNQPSFLPDGSAILFSSSRGGSPQDIYQYTIATHVVRQVTRTAESEFSPLVTPDGRTFSVIRVEAGGAQRLWRFDLDGLNMIVESVRPNPSVILENVKPVGYHAWVDNTHLALFVLGAPASETTPATPITLQFADTTTGAAEVIDSRIGRSLHVRPGTGTVSYIAKPQGAPWLVRQFDPKTKQTTTLTETPGNVEDCAWLADGTLLMSSGTKIMRWRAGSTWTEFTDLSGAGVQRITRLAVGPARSGTTPLAFVAEPAPGR